MIKIWNKIKFCNFVGSCFILRILSFKVGWFILNMWFELIIRCYFFLILKGVKILYLIDYNLKYWFRNYCFINCFGIFLVKGYVIRVYMREWVFLNCRKICVGIGRWFWCIFDVNILLINVIMFELRRFLISFM